MEMLLNKNDKLSLNFGSNLILQEIVNLCLTLYC